MLAMREASVVPLAAVSSADGDPDESVPQKKRNCGRSFVELMRRLRRASKATAFSTVVIFSNCSSEMTRKLPAVLRLEAGRLAVEDAAERRKRPPRPMARMNPRMVSLSLCLVVFFYATAERDSSRWSSSRIGE